MVCVLGGQYFNTPTQSAWTVYATAHPDESVVSRYLIVDTGGAPASGANTYYFHRVSLGANKMYIEGAARSRRLPKQRKPLLDR